MSIQDIVKRAVLALGFEERTGLTAFDSSPKHNNATLLKDNGVLPAWVAGKDGFGGALEFDGTGAYVRCVGFKPTVSAGFTALILFKTSATGVRRFLINQWGAGGAGNSSWGIEQTTLDKILFRTYDGVGSYTVETVDTHNDDLWHRAVLVFHADGLLTGYIDGTSIGSAAAVIQDSTNYDVFIGREVVGGEWWDGLLDEVIILPYPLTSAEVRALEESRSAFTATPNLRRGLVLDMDFQEGTGLTAFDKSWYRNNGVLGPGADAITDEGFTSVFDTSVQLKHTNITPGTTVVTDNGNTYTEGPANDYTMDNPNGTITILSTGTMADDTAYLIDYDFAGSYPVWVEGGLYFDGIDDYVDCGNDASTNIAGAKSVVIWVTPTSLPPIGETTGLVTRNPSFLFVIHGNYGLTFQDKSNFVNRVDAAHNVLTVDEQYMLVGTSDGLVEDNQEIYVDALNYLGSHNWGYGGPTANRLRVGGQSHDNGQWQHGVIHRVLVYNREITRTEIRALEAGGPSI